MGVNINFGKNKKLLEQCQTLKEYAIYVKKVRTYAKSMKVEEAVDRAVTECINEGILREFLLQNRKEAVEMSIFVMKRRSLKLSGKMNMRKASKKAKNSLPF